MMEGFYSGRRQQVPLVRHNRRSVLLRKVLERCQLLQLGLPRKLLADRVYLIKKIQLQVGIDLGSRTVVVVKALPEMESRVKHHGLKLNGAAIHTHSG